MALSVLTFDNPAFKSFAFYATASVSKMMLMSFLTVKQRVTHASFVNQEDTVNAYPRKGVTPKFNDEPVERVRRNHLNDMENIPPFVLLGLFYICTGPTFGTALWHFRIFLASRICHTIAYQLALPQPSRALSYLAGMAVNISMAVQTIMAAYNAM